MRSRTLRAAAGLLLLILLATAAPSFAQESKQLYWQRWDADVAINTDGSFAVTETQEIVFTSGSFRFGTRNIKTDRLRDITDVQVTADGQALPTALAMASRIAANSPLAVVLAKDAALASFETPLAQGLEHEKRNFFVVLRSADNLEGQAAFLGKRAPNFTGH